MAQNLTPVQYNLSPNIDPNTQALFTNFTNILAEVYTHIPQKIANKIAMSIPGGEGGELTTSLWWSAMPPALRVWTGARQHKNVTSRSQVFKNIRFESTVDLDRNVVMNDRNGVYSRVLGDLGKQMVRWPDQQVSLALACGRGNHTAVGGEDVAAVAIYNQNALNYWNNTFFAASKPVSPGNLNGITGTNQNLMTSVTTLTETALVNAIELLQQTKNEDGLVAGFGLGKILLIVPTSLSYAAKRLCKAGYFSDELSTATTSGIVDNKGLFADTVEFVINPYLATDSVNKNTWFICDAEWGNEFLGLVQSQMELTVLASPDNAIVFEQDIVVYGVKVYGGVAYASDLPVVCVTDQSS